MNKKKSAKTKSNFVVGRYIKESVLTPEVEAKYTNLYGRIVCRCAGTLGGYYLWFEPLNDSSPVVIQGVN